MSNDEFVQLRTVETIVYITTARLSITLFSVISKWDDVESSPYLECLVTTIRLSERKHIIRYERKSKPRADPRLKSRPTTDPKHKSRRRPDPRPKSRPRHDPRHRHEPRPAHALRIPRPQGLLRLLGEASTGRLDSVVRARSQRPHIRSPVPRHIALPPCLGSGHACVCRRCALKLDKCPLCRVRIQAQTRFYL